MSYNEIEINGSTVQGHRYAGGGVDTISHDYIGSGDTSYSFTLSWDCFANIIFFNSVAPSAEWIVYVNNIEQGRLYTYTSADVYNSMSLPLKKGDVVKIDINNKGSSSCFIRVLRNLYRS